MANRSSIVYTGALWHEDCDPFVTVVATSKAKALDLLKDAADQEWGEDADNAFWGECPNGHEHTAAHPFIEDEHIIVCSRCQEIVAEDDIKTGGISEALLSEQELDAEQLRDLELNGYVFV